MTGDSLAIGDYELGISEVISVIRRARAKRVLVQLPEGLKRYYPAIAESIRAEADLEVHLDAGPLYGSCLIDRGAAASYDLVVHIGHDPYPLVDYSTSRVLFVDLEYVGVRPEVIAGEVKKHLRNLGARDIAIVTTNQHKKLSKSMKEELEAEGFSVVLGPLVIFGCYVPPELRGSRVEAVIVVAGGLFHSIGVGMSVRDAVVLRADPYTRSVTDVSRDVSRFISVRLKKMYDALDAGSWGILVGVSGQYRPLIVDRLRGALSKKGCRHYLYVAPVLDINVLRNLDSPEVEAYVATSCPRIAVDDLAEFEKPVLTPSEAMVVLERGEVSEYPENLLY